MEDEILQPTESVETETVETEEVDTDLMEVLKKINAGEYDEESNEEESKTDEEQPTEVDEGEVFEETEEPKVQSKEENARFARERRERETQARIQAEIDRVRNESAEFKLAQQMAELYGKTPEQLMQELAEAQLQKEATDRNVPIELLREQRERDSQLSSMQEEINQLKYERWEMKVESDKQSLKTRYPMLDDSHFDQAIDYMFNTLKSVDIPLEQAVYAIHGETIVNALTNAKTQEQLAKASGRKKSTPLPLGRSKADNGNTLTAEEKFVAKSMGISEADYLKYK